MSDSVRPHRWQPTRLPCPWDSPGKNTGVGCHFLLQCVKVKSLSCDQLFATPWTAAYQAPPSMVFQARVLEWVAIAFSVMDASRRQKTTKTKNWIPESETKDFITSINSSGQGINIYTCTSSQSPNFHTPMGKNLDLF